MTREPQPTYLRSGEVAEILRVSPKTVSRYAADGLLPHQKTLGGHRRYAEAEVLALAERLTVPANPAAKAERDPERPWRTGGQDGTP